MALVAYGLTNDEIAHKLYMSPATARTHVSRAMTKLGVRDRAAWPASPVTGGLSPAARRQGRTRTSFLVGPQPA